VSQVMLGVTGRPPFILSVKQDQPEAARGVPASLTVVASRSAGFGEEIALTATGLPPNVAPGLKNIPKGQNEVKVQLTPAANAPLGAFSIAFTGKANFQGRDYAVTAPPLNLTLVLPFTLSVEPAALKLSAGGKAKLK